MRLTYLFNTVAIGLIFTAALQLVACDAEDDDATNQPDTSCTSAVETLCRAYADHGVTCGDSTPTERDQDLADCLDDAAEIPMNCSYARSVASCLGGNDCATSDDRCVFEGLLDVAPSGWNIPTLRDCVSGAVTDDATCDTAIGGITRTCIDRLEECIGGPYEGATNAPFIDDHCYTIVALTPEAIAEATECLDSPCDAIGACLSAAGTFGY